jgi:LCP family protein required for cell wall assembly
MVLSILIIIINIILSGYLLRINNFLDTSFNNLSNTYTMTYYVLSNKDNNYSIDDLNNNALSYYEDGDNIDKGLEELSNKVNIEKNAYNDLNNMFVDLKDKKIDFVLIDKSSYEFVMSLDNTLSNDDFNVIYQFDVTISDDSLKSVDAGNSFNIYIAGKDFTYTNNDFNMIISVNMKKKEILLTSMPRDYYVEVYGKGGRKDTLSYMGAYGTMTSLKSLENLLDINIDYYVDINTKSLVGLVDAVGGINYCSNESYTTTHPLLLDTYNDSLGSKLYVKEGCQDLTGIEALTVARERLNITGGDTQRQKNCELIMEAILAKLKSTNTITNFNNVLTAVSDLYKTNMSKDKFTDIIKDILSDNDWKINKYELDGRDSKNYVHLTNLIDWVMNPDYQTVDHDKELIHNLMS